MMVNGETNYNGVNNYSISAFHLTNNLLITPDYNELTIAFHL
jgi:hypothetical protein